VCTVYRPHNDASPRLETERERINIKERRKKEKRKEEKRREEKKKRKEIKYNVHICYHKV